MAELKATPGPYKVVHSLNIVSGDGRRGIANCGGHSSYKEDMFEENVANAHLLATSWKLYHALGYLLMVLKNIPGTDEIRLRTEEIMAEARGEATS